MVPGEAVGQLLVVPGQPGNSYWESGEHSEALSPWLPQTMLWLYQGAISWMSQCPRPPPQGFLGKISEKPISSEKTNPQLPQLWSLLKKHLKKILD